MDNLKELMASMARKREKPVNEKSEIGGGLTTSDGKEFDSHGVSAVRMLLAGCSQERLKNFDQTALFDRLTENFIKSNTEQDLKDFMAHNLAIKLLNIITR